MSILKLVAPTTEYKEQVLEYKMEFLRSNDTLDGTAGLQNYKTFEEWYGVYCDNLNESTARKGFVPSSTFLAVSIEDNRLVGMIDIRHRLNDYLFMYGGNIGYSIRKTERRKGYASQMLKLALDECRELGILKVLITCDKDNIGSAKTILKNGGVLENETENNGEIVQRYWIDL